MDGPGGPPQALRSGGAGEWSGALEAPLFEATVDVSFEALRRVKADGLACSSFHTGSSSPLNRRCGMTNPVSHAATAPRWATVYFLLHCLPQVLVRLRGVVESLSLRPLIDHLKNNSVVIYLIDQRRFLQHRLKNLPQEIICNVSGQKFFTSQIDYPFLFMLHLAVHNQRTIRIHLFDETGSLIRRVIWRAE